MDSDGLLTPSDIKYVRHVLGRAPSEEELNFIAGSRQKYLTGRVYTEILTRLDEGSRRQQIPEATLTDPNGRPIVCYSDIVAGKGLNQYQSERVLLETQNGTRSAIRLKDVLTGKSTAENSSVKPQINANKQIGKTEVGLIRTTHPVLSESPPVGSLVYFIPLSQRTPKRKSLYFSTVDLAKHSILLSRIVDQFGPLSGLIDLCLESSFGVIIRPGNNTINEPGFLYVIHPQNADGFCTHLKELNISFQTFGAVQLKKEITVEAGDNGPINLPLDIFKFPWNVYSTQTFTGRAPVADIKVPELKKPSYNDWFLNIWRELNRTGSFAFMQEKEQTKASDSWCISRADTLNYLQDHPRLAGQLALAQAARRSACMGAKPVGVLLSTVVPDGSEADIAWRVSELFQGQEVAVRMLNLPLLKRNIVTGSDLAQSVNIVGLFPDKFISPARGFGEADDFISILGSHRGELGYSLYMEIIHQSQSGALPACDLTMEERIREAILVGIQTGLIKSAQSVDQGGLAVALAKGLKEGSPDLGARVYFSRKLRSDEILFGETQGLVLITIGEADIMEFERICMSLGVPSTTIGRVTGTGKLTFNDLMDIAVKDIE